MPLGSSFLRVLIFSVLFLACGLLPGWNPPVRAENPSDNAGKAYWLHVSSFRTEAKAAVEVRRLTKRGLNAFANPEQVKGRKW